MPSNTADAVPAIRLDLGSRALTGDAPARLRSFLAASGLRKVFVRGAGDHAAMLAAAVALRDTFAVAVECDAAAYTVLRGRIPPGAPVTLLPVFDLDGDPAELGALLALLPTDTAMPADLLLRNPRAVTDAARTRAALGRIRETVGDRPLRFHWDCGFVLCAFTESDLGWFIERGSDPLCCCPSMVRVGADLDLTICDKLREPAVPCGTGPVRGALDAFQAALAPYRSFGVLKACGTCRYFQTLCSGGCQAHVRAGFV